jgi:pimeloyl-ACP methyl ester carboxylesterase
VVSLFEAEELRDVVLCGHSAGGAVITAVADRIPDRISHLVYLDAVVPHSGESVFDVVGDAEGVPAYLDATSPDNRRLYERHQFVVRQTLTLRDSPPLWSMLRVAQGRQ